MEETSPRPPGPPWPSHWWLRGTEPSGRSQQASWWPTSEVGARGRRLSAGAGMAAFVDLESSIGGVGPPVCMGAFLFGEREISVSRSRELSSGVFGGGQ